MSTNGTEVGNQTQVAYIAESTLGTTPATPAGQILRWLTFTLAGSKNYIENNELRTDRMRIPGRGGSMIGKGDLTDKLSYGTFDDFIAAALGTPWATNVSKIGNTRESFTFEKAHLVNGIYFPFTGVVVDTMELSGKVNDAVDVKFGLIAKHCGTEAATTLFTSTTPQTTSDLITTWEGTITRGGTSAAVTSWSLKLDNQYEQASVCGSPDLYDLRAKTAKVTGSLELYFDSPQAYADFRTDADWALHIGLGSGTSKSYSLDLARCRATSFKSEPKDGLMTCSFDFEGFVPLTGTDTSLKCTRIA